jgi:hypothetical protein
MTAQLLLLSATGKRLESRYFMVMPSCLGGYSKPIDYASNRSPAVWHPALRCVVGADSARWLLALADQAAPGDNWNTSRLSFVG